MKTRTKESKRRLHSLILLTAFTAVLLIVSTYAWFTKQEVVSVNSLRGKVEVAEGLEISLDAENWAGELDLASKEVSLLEQSGTGDVIYGAYANHENHVSPEFLPVSTSGETRSSIYGNESITSTEMDRLIMYTGDYAGSQLTGVKEITRDGHNVSGDLIDPTAGYIAFDVFIKNATKNTRSEGETLQLDSGSYAWVLPEEKPIIEGEGNDALRYEGDQRSGLQNTIRVAFAKYGNAVNSGDEAKIDSTADAASVIGAVETQKISQVAIWEPNSDAHVSHVLTNVKPIMSRYITDMSGYLTATTGNKFFTYTLNKEAKGKATIDVFDWDGGKTEFTKTWTMQTSDLGDGKGLIGSGNTDIKTITNTPETTENFDTIKLAPNSITRLKIYIWIEGQDPDCVNFASYGGGVHVNLSFTKNKQPGEDGSASGGRDEDDAANVVDGNSVN